MPSKRLSALQRKREITSEGTADTSAVQTKAVAHGGTPSCKVVKAMAAQEFEDLFFENRSRGALQLSRKFTYMYSEGYQNIERLLTSVGKSLKARSTFAEFRIIEEMCRRKIEKGQGEKARGGERRESGPGTAQKSRRNR